MSKIFERLGAWSVRFRYFVVVAWIGALIAALAFLPSLGSVVQNNFANFLPQNSPSIKAANLAATLQKTNASIVIVVADSPNAPITASESAYLNGLAGRLQKVSGVIKAEVSAVAPSGRAEQIEVLSQKSQFNATSNQRLVDAVQGQIGSPPPPSGLQIHLAGTVATAVAQASQNGTSANSTQLYSVLFILLLLLSVFRSLLAPFLTLIPAFLVSVLAGPIVARLTSVLNFQVSNVTQLLMIVLVLGAGTDYGLFLVFRTREEMRRGKSAKEAVRFAVSKVGESITFSALTVIAAVLSLAGATFGLYRGLGYPLGIAVFLMLLAGVTLQPALLAIFGRAAFWPSKVGKTEAPSHGWWGRVAGRLVAKPRLTLTVGVLFFAGLAVLAPLNRPSGFASNTSAPSNSSAAAGNQALSKYFPHAAYNPTELIFKFDTPIWQHLQTLSFLQAKISGSRLFQQVNSGLEPAGITLTTSQLARLHAKFGSASSATAGPGTLAKAGSFSSAKLGYAASANAARAFELYHATANYISPDGKTVLFAVTLTAGDPGLNPAINSVPTLRTFTASLGRQAGASATGVAGEAPAAYDVSSASNSDLIHIVPLVIVIIALLLALVLRSAVAPLFLVVSVALSYFAALGLSVLIFMLIGGNSGLIFILPFMLFLFLLALGEDYNILVMTRIREESYRKPIREAVIDAVGATGSTITSAGMVLAGTFLVLGLASAGQSEVEQIGVGLALGVLMDTFLVRTLLVPSLVVLLGRVTWWPSSLSHFGHEQANARATGGAAIVAGEVVG